MTEISVAAVIRFDYDTEDGVADNEAEAIKDVESFLPDSGFTITALSSVQQELQDCADAREGDSNDAEIEALWSAVESMASLLGLTIPEPAEEVDD